MKRAGRAWVAMVVTGLVFVAVGTALSQQLVSPVGNATVQMRPYTTPQYSVSPNPPISTVDRKTWIHVECKYQTLPEWMDDLTLTFYVLVKTQDQKRPYIMLKGEFAYQHIAKGPHIAAAYVHPSIVARYGRVEAAAVEFKFNGIVVQQVGSRNDFTVWTKQLPPMENTLLPPSETPFGPTHFYYGEMPKAPAR